MWSLTSVITALWLVAMPTAADPPAPAREPIEDVLDRAGEALEWLHGDSFVGEYSSSTHTTISTLDGDVKHDERLLERVSRRAGEEVVRSIVQATRDGEDVTAERRRDRAGEKDRADGGGKQSVTLSVRLPDAGDLPSYTIEGPRREGDLLVATFAPLPAAKVDEDAGSGRVAWKADTTEPVWLEYIPARKPKRVKEFQLRFEFDRSHGWLYPSRIVSRGVGGFLFIKRSFVSETVIGDLTLADP